MKKSELKQIIKECIKDVLLKEASETYINVPYKDKDIAKNMGAKWNPDNKKWFLKVYTEKQSIDRSDDVRDFEKENPGERHGMRDVEHRYIEVVYINGKKFPLAAVKKKYPQWFTQVDTRTTKEIEHARVQSELEKKFEGKSHDEIIKGIADILVKNKIYSPSSNFPYVNVFGRNQNSEDPTKVLVSNGIPNKYIDQFAKEIDSRVN